MKMLVNGATTTFAKYYHRYISVIGKLVCQNNYNSLHKIVQSHSVWASDNGAFSNFDPIKFRKYIQKLKNKPRCLFLTVPDKVGNAVETLQMFNSWYDECKNIGHPLLFVAQDGIENISIPWRYIDGIFIGGSDNFKESQSARICVRTAKKLGKYAHMGRVNSLRRIDLAYYWGCDSIDGTAVSMFPEIYIPKFCSHLLKLLSTPKRKYF